MLGGLKKGSPVRGTGSAGFGRGSLGRQRLRDGPLDKGLSPGSG